ncbi:hypothetical protein PQR14_22130 [Paraburkholderia bryophila]|uniref:hypothetical protein n=1 Tax=Paraburkholderia bryophila TaxID=420952 RepID=UPI0038B753D8
MTRTTPTGTAPAQSLPSQSSLVGPTSQSDSPSNVIDLTPWLGEGSAVRVQKSVREPAGAFSISFVDELMNLPDSLYTLIEPMDLIEIRFAGDAYKYAGAAGQQLPIIMRGFVSDVERDQRMSADGKPQRIVSVTGHDYQKILQLIQIFNTSCTPDVANAISSFPLFSKYGEELNVMSTTQFVLHVLSLIVNPYIAGMQQASATSGAALDLIAADVQVPDALVSVQLGAFNNGTVQQLLEEYLDVGPFNEFFIEDRDAGSWGPAGPYAVYRPMPLVDPIQKQGLQPIQSSVTTGVLPGSPIKTTLDTDNSTVPAANVVTIQSDSIISINARRSDAGVANYYFVDAPRFSMNYDYLTREYATYATQQGAIPFYITDYGNVNPKLYGLRKMQVQTQQGSKLETNSGNGTAAGEARSNNQGYFLQWIDNRRNLLIALNRDNVVLESGAIHLRGNEKIRAGTYVQISYGNGLQSLYYAYSVTHVYEPYGSYLTEVEYDRGTNFVDRLTAAQGSGSPYFAEMLPPGGQ